MIFTCWALSHPLTQWTFMCLRPQTYYTCPLSSIILGWVQTPRTYPVMGRNKLNFYKVLSEGEDLIPSLASCIDQCRFVKAAVNETDSLKRFK